MPSPVASVRIQTSMVLLLGVAIARSLWDPISANQQWLQHVGTPIVVPLLFVTARRARFSNVAFACLVAFYLLHTIGARYLYTDVPGGKRLSWLALGSGGTDRNHYDRLVHLAFGLSMMPALVELLAAKLGRNGARWAAMVMLLAISALYEVFEWLLTVVADPADADRYNGQQGDMWDMQKDMFLAWVGSLMAFPWVGRRSYPN